MWYIFLGLFFLCVEETQIRNDYFRLPGGECSGFLVHKYIEKKNNGGELEVWKYIPVTSPATFKDTNRPRGFQHEYFEMLNQMAEFSEFSHVFLNLPLQILGNSLVC